MVKITLIYPYFQPHRDNSIFRFPPLGLGYVAAALKKHGFKVDLVDCTFQSKTDALHKARHSNADIIGIYSMFSMKKTTLEIANELREDCSLMIAGGPLPTLDPTEFLDIFDVAVIGEGEKTTVDLAKCFEKGCSFSVVKGIAYKDRGTIRVTPQRTFVKNLDELPFPSRELFDNQAYISHYRKRFGYSTTPLISSRGCPFACDFCSRPVFGSTFRSRSAKNIVTEIEEIKNLGYDRVWFADDCFTLSPQHLQKVCNLLVEHQVNIGWECLSRVDTLDFESASAMKAAGCMRVFFGIESGNNTILNLMNKCITTQQAQNAVKSAKQAGLQVGAFFILGYPGESDQTVLDTIRFASSLPLDYLSFTLPYPIPGTKLHERVKDNGGTVVDDWEEPRNCGLIRHKLLYGSGFSETKLKFAIGKAQLQFWSRKLLGNRIYGTLGRPLETLTDEAFKLMR